MPENPVSAVAILASMWLAALPLHAQPEEYVISAEFDTPLTVSGALSRLDAFYQKEIQKQNTLVRVSNTTYYDVWRDIWFVFEQVKPAMLHARIESRSDGSNDYSSQWIQEGAVLLGGPQAIAVRKGEPISGGSATIPATEKEIATYLRDRSGYAIRAYPNWHTEGLYMSASPRLWALVWPDALNGTVSMTAYSGDADAVRKTVAGMKTAPAHQRIAVLTSSIAEVDQDIRNEAGRRVREIVDQLAKDAHPYIDIRGVEQEVRDSPVFQKRLLEAASTFLVKFRTDKDYQKVNLRWFELEGFSSVTQQFSGQKLMKEADLADVRRNPDAGHLFVIPVPLPELKPGGYRVQLRGTTPGGAQNNIDERTYFYNGSVFTEQ